MNLAQASSSSSICNSKVLDFIIVLLSKLQALRLFLLSQV
uniref:Uncharacterized protein n=1 Tax=Anguilla anguilla TaxID=7936 RepID=A0A0E9QDY2_ANGAN